MAKSTDVETRSLKARLEALVPIPRSLAAMLKYSIASPNQVALDPGPSRLGPGPLRLGGDLDACAQSLEVGFEDSFKKKISHIKNQTTIFNLNKQQHDDHLTNINCCNEMV